VLLARRGWATTPSAWARHEQYRHVPVALPVFRGHPQQLQVPVQVQADCGPLRTEVGQEGPAAVLVPVPLAVARRQRVLPVPVPVLVAVRTVVAQVAHLLVAVIAAVPVVHLLVLPRVLVPEVARVVPAVVAHVVVQLLGPLGVRVDRSVRVVNPRSSVVRNLTTCRRHQSAVSRCPVATAHRCGWLVALR